MENRPTRATIQFKDRPLSDIWTVHFGPDSSDTGEDLPCKHLKTDK